MSKVMKKAYGEPMKQEFDLRSASQEAARCLLCYEAPCSESCPAGTDPAKFIRSLRFRNVKGAAETVRENNPLAGCCAEVCPYGQLCEEGCSRSGIDRPIEIGKIQRFLVRQEREQKMVFLHAAERKEERIACLGAGPASLACARELALRGYPVTVYEAQEKAGGMLACEIIPSRLPREVVDFDIQTIEDLGVEFRFGEKIDAAGLGKLREEYDAVFVGTGLCKPKMPDLPGIGLAGVENALDFLREIVESGGKQSLKSPVIVIGGGDVAMDCATAAKQLGATTKIVYRRTVEEAPADIDEVTAVQGMGIPIIQEFAPAEILGKDGWVSAMRFRGRDDESELVLKAGQVVFAVGQAEDESTKGITAGGNVFTGGDRTNGGKTVVQAVADGKESAEQIAAYLAGRQKGGE